MELQEQQADRRRRDRTRAASDDPSPSSAGGILARLAAARSASLPSDDKFARDHPNLWELLTVRDGLSSDGKNGTSITLVCEGTAYTVIISAKGSGLTTNVTLYTLQGFTRAIENALTDPRTVWRPIKDWKPKEEKKKKTEKAGEG